MPNKRSRKQNKFANKNTNDKIENETTKENGKNETKIINKNTDVSFKNDIIKNEVLNNNKTETNFKNGQIKNGITKKEITNSRNIVRPNAITLAGFCAICWRKAVHFCPQCTLVGYCCLSHMANHWSQHQSLCTIVTKMITENKGYLYGLEILTPDTWRFLRIQILQQICLLLKRSPENYERDLILFPKHCSTCYETKINKLVSCNKCCQVWWCRNSDHIQKNHFIWCNKLQLFANLVQRQAEGKLFMYDMNFGPVKSEEFNFTVNDEITKVIKLVLNNYIDLDVCNMAMISQTASGPLTVLYAIHASKMKPLKSFVIHLIGAELHYEGNTLQAWESFFLHFLPNVLKLTIIMIGPELNATVTQESMRLCTECKKQKKTLNFEYRDNLLYHEYAASKAFTKPDIVCAFNPGLHRNTGFNQTDTWPQTIQSAVASNCPFIFTAYTSYEAPLDMERIRNNANVHIIQSPKLNPFASLKPDRNFISDQEAPLIFKNYYLSIVTS